MELSPRLQGIAEWVSQGAKLADVGTDHGLLPVCLLRQGVVEQAIASDLRAGPLDAARRNAVRFGVEHRISFRLCDGLSGISPGEADTVVIAGMGGETIAGILRKAPWTREQAVTLLLQPQSTFPELRAFLWESGYRILREKIIREGNRLYIIIEAQAGIPESFRPGELWVGKQSRDPLRGEYLHWMSGVLSKAIAGQQQASHINRSELTWLQEALAEIQTMEKEWTSWQ